MRRLTLGPGLPDSLTLRWPRCGEDIQTRKSPGLASGRLDTDKGRGGTSPMEETGGKWGRGEGIPGSGLNASEGRALWKNLSHQAHGFSLWEAGGCTPSSLDTLLSNSLKQYVHTDTASWRKSTKDTLPMPTTRTHAPRWLTHLLQPWGGGFSWGLMAKAWAACQKTGGQRRWNTCTPPCQAPDKV